MDEQSRHLDTGEELSSHARATALRVVVGDDGGDLVLFLRGRIEGAALEDLGSWLETAIASSAPRIQLDLGEVTRWSLLAQAMVLSSSRRLSTRGRELVLRNPSAELREQSRRLDVFGRVPTQRPGS